MNVRTITQNRTAHEKISLTTIKGEIARALPADRSEVRRRYRRMGLLGSKSAKLTYALDVKAAKEKRHN